MKMINNIKKKIGVMTLIISLLLNAVPIEAKSVIKPTILKPNTVYYYDLDQDGKKEKIYYKFLQAPIDWYELYSVRLYINDKLAYDSNENTKYGSDNYPYTCDNSGVGFTGFETYKIMDLNTKDKALDLLLTMSGESLGQVYQAF